MQYVVLDLEFNQPSKAIIQIGAVVLNCRSGYICDEFECLVKIDEQLDEYIVDLTGITQADLSDRGIPLSDALTRFWQLVGSKPIMSWGKDHDIIIENSRSLGIAHNDVRTMNISRTGELLRNALPNSKKSGGLLSTMSAFGLEFEGRQHNALIDARNTARLAYKFIAMVRACNEVGSIIGGLDARV